ncbi:hypothetical protein XELAEV_18031431mg [Xenopus laevis]|uniref:Reverse transcriptase RNase H-like domain-containing protein n=1 Tax=Xenopus laevis TaxID=8355 RepID=A0A974CNC4_XENLA|nr:hypothetical protein XELAEV_18031431mg [Xenopus laevis]
MELKDGKIKKGRTLQALLDLVLTSLSLTVKLQVSYNLQYSYIERLLVQLKNCRHSAVLLQHSINKLTADSVRSCYLNRRRSNKNCFVTQESDLCNTLTDATNRGNPTDSEISNIAPVLFQYNEKVLVGFNNLNNLNAAIFPTFPCEFQTYSNVYVKIIRAAIIHTNKLHQKFKSEQNYDVSDRELLAIKLAYEEWRFLLEGAKHPVIVYTDHRNLEYLRSAKRLRPRQARWAMFFMRFCFHITYRPESLMDRLKKASSSVTDVISGRYFQYLVKRKGYGIEENSWEPHLISILPVFFGGFIGLIQKSQVTRAADPSENKYSQADDTRETSLAYSRPPDQKKAAAERMETGAAGLILSASSCSTRSHVPIIASSHCRLQLIVWRLALLAGKSVGQQNKC